MDKIDEYEIYEETERLAVSATSSILAAMDRANLSRSELAKMLDLPKSRITKILDGESNLTLKTFAQIGLACNVRWQLVGVDAQDSTVIVTAPEGMVYADPCSVTPTRYVQRKRDPAGPSTTATAGETHDCGSYAVAA